MSWEKEYRTLKWFGLENGMKILEVGSGPGYLTERLLQHLPLSEITALDIDEVLLEKAQQRLNHIPKSKLTFTKASVYQTNLPEQSYDFVIARLLFLHLHHPLQAVAELSRVLKPGGKLVIIDIDDGIMPVINPELDVLPSVLKKLAQQQAARGGNRYIGRGLPRLLSEAEFSNIDLEAVIQHSDLHGLEGFVRQFDSNRFTRFYENGVITEQEYNELKKSYLHFVNSPDAHAMMVFLMACGTKPL